MNKKDEDKNWHELQGLDTKNEYIGTFSPLSL